VEDLRPDLTHWYNPETFGRLIAACIQRDRESGRRRPLREFLKLFDGLKRTPRHSKILTTLGLSRTDLNDLFAR
jgi:hypothetical protein